MAAPIVTRSAGLLLCHSGCVYRAISTTVAPCAGAKWRLSQGKAEDNKRYGPLTDLPDYSFLDGRPTPLNIGQRRRQEEKRQLSKRIVTLVQEIDFAKSNYARKQQEEQNRRQNILQNKLNPKVDSSGKAISKEGIKIR